MYPVVKKDAHLIMTLRISAPDCDPGRRDSRMFASARIGSRESSFVTLAGHGSGSWSGNDATK